MECRAMKKVRDEMGLTNVQLMVPFVRTVGEGKAWSTCWPNTA
jgi:pyruvate,water dikinase